MRIFRATAVVGLCLMGAVDLASAQPYGGRDYGGRDGYRDRDYGDRYRGRDDEDYDRRDRRRDVGFDEREYLRCNPDVRRAIAAGNMESAAAHYRVFGRREGRRLTC